MQVYLTIIIIIAVIGLIVWYKSRKSDGGIEVFTDVRQHTANGLTVYSENGVSDYFLSNADESLSGLFATCRRRGYTNGLTHSAYTVYVINGTMRNGIPVFLVPAPDYDGTEYDQDPRAGYGLIYVAEKVVGDYAYIVCHSEDAAYIQNAVRYGAEHLVLLHNDTEEYERTKFHGGGINHPII